MNTGEIILYTSLTVGVTFLITKVLTYFFSPDKKLDKEEYKKDLESLKQKIQRLREDSEEYTEKAIKVLEEKHSLTFSRIEEIIKVQGEKYEIIFKSIKDNIEDIKESIKNNKGGCEK